MAHKKFRTDESALSRGYILDILDAQAKRDRGNEEDIHTYLIEDVVYLKVGRRFPQSRETMRSHLYYLRDRGYAKCRNVEGEKNALMWRITADGVDVIEGVKSDKGVLID